MRYAITEVFYKQFSVGKVLVQAVLTRQEGKIIGIPFDYRPGYQMVMRGFGDTEKRKEKGVRFNFDIPESLRWAIKEAAYKNKMTSKDWITEVLKAACEKELKRRILLSGGQSGKSQAQPKTESDV